MFWGSKQDLNKNIESQIKFRCSYKKKGVWAKMAKWEQKKNASKNNKVQSKTAKQKIQLQQTTYNGIVPGIMKKHKLQQHNRS